MIYVLYVLEVLVCLFLILVVLLQQGSGADLSVFGGGATQTAFGARGTTQFIHKLTVWAFVAFILLTLAIAVYKGGASSASVMTGADTSTSAKAPAKGAKVYFVQDFGANTGQPMEKLAATWRLPLHRIVISRYIDWNPEYNVSLAHGSSERGGTVVYLSPGARWQTGLGLDLEGAVQIPVVESLYGVQDEHATARVALSMSR